MPRVTARHITLLLALGACLLYWNTSAKLADTDAYEREDIYFRCDSHRVFRDLVLGRNERHARTDAHPCFVLLHQPFGYGLSVWLKESVKLEFSTARRDAARVLTTAAGAGVVVMMFATLLALGLQRGPAALFTGVLACSCSQIFFASVPETYIFSALGLVAVAMNSIRRPCTPMGWWLASAVYAFANLTSNGAQIGLWAMARHAEPRRSISHVLLLAARSVLIVIAILVALSLVQKWIFPKTTLFFLPDSVEGQSVWLYWGRLSTPLETARIVLQHMLTSNIVAPEPALSSFNDQPMASIEAGAWAMILPAWPLLSLWIAVLIGGISGLCKGGTWRSPPMLAALGSMVFCFCFFAVFGNDRMLYSMTWTPFTVLLVAAGWKAWLEHKPQLLHPLMAALSVLVIGQAWHHWHFLDKIWAIAH